MEKSVIRGEFSMNANKVLIAAVSEEIRSSLSSWVMEAGLKDVSVSDGKNIRDLSVAGKYDVIVSVLPFENEFGLDAVGYIDKMTNSQQCIFVPSKVYDDVCLKIQGLGVTVLPKNAPRSIAVNALRCAGIEKDKLDELRSENEALVAALNETKIVNRAKCVLVEYLRIPESEAHKQIQKRAMDQRVTLSEVARDILRTYEYRKGNLT